MGAATWIARQLAKTDDALLRVQAGMPLQVGSDPLCQGVLYGLGLKGLRIVAGYKAYPAFAWPVMGFGGYPAQLLAAYTNQMPGRMQAGMQPTAGFVDLSLCPACRYGHADVVHDSILSLHNLDDLAVADPARVAGLPAALGMKGGGAEDDGKPVFLGRAVDDFDLAAHGVVIEKQALGHGGVPERVSFLV